MRHIVAKKIVKSLTQQQLFYENFVLSSEVRIKEKEKNCSAVCKKNIYVYIKTCWNSQTIISSSGYEVCLENYKAIDKDCVNVDGQCTTTKLADWGGVGKDQDHWGGVGKDQGL